MRTFRCQCGVRLHFENSQCLNCGRTLGYVPEQRALMAFEPETGGRWRPVIDEAAPVTSGLFRKCANYEQYHVCNWMVPDQDSERYCLSCRLNHIIPNLTEPDNLTLWYRIEVAKRRLLYTLIKLGLPIAGMSFRFLADEKAGDEFVLTGHSGGTITINIAEARHSERERMREEMNEGYRTLLGHFRHESGHYYWGRLIKDGDLLEAFRALFGDERQDYQQALKTHYSQGAPVDWKEHFISAYASSHPWEDWAETWTHYLHMTDTLETAIDMGFLERGDPGASFDELIDDWVELTVGLNALNRSMGLQDAYPFAFSGPVIDKLLFVHTFITGNRA